MLEGCAIFSTLLPRCGLPTPALSHTLQLFTCAESLGAVESLAESPAIMTHASVPPEIRAQLGISDALVRLSVGLEVRHLNRRCDSKILPGMPHQRALLASHHGVSILLFLLCRTSPT